MSDTMTSVKLINLHVLHSRKQKVATCNVYNTGHMRNQNLLNMSHTVFYACSNIIDSVIKILTDSLLL